MKITLDDIPWLALSLSDRDVTEIVIALGKGKDVRVSETDEEEITIDGEFFAQVRTK